MVVRRSFLTSKTVTDSDARLYLSLYVLNWDATGVDVTIGEMVLDGASEHPATRLMTSSGLAGSCCR